MAVIELVNIDFSAMEAADQRAFSQIRVDGFVTGDSINTRTAGNIEVEKKRIGRLLAEHEALRKKLSGAV